MGNLDRAAECVDKALAMDPGRNDILLGLSTAFVMAGNLDRAEALVRRYLEMDPPLPLKAFAWARLGQLEQRQGNLPEGEKLMNAAAAMDPHLWRGFMPPPAEIFTRP
ncbi:MAG: tetratricopeptide repeat protein [bacterium]|nr:tetratricopeptide repeat protein [bacterium]